MRLNEERWNLKTTTNAKKQGLILVWPLSLMFSLLSGRSFWICLLLLWAGSGCGTTAVFPVGLVLRLLWGEPWTGVLPMVPFRTSEACWPVRHPWMCFLFIPTATLEGSTVAPGGDGDSIHHLKQLLPFWNVAKHFDNLWPWTTPPPSKVPPTALVWPLTSPSLILLGWDAQLLSEFSQNYKN